MRLVRVALPGVLVAGTIAFAPAADAAGIATGQTPAAFAASIGVPADALVDATFDVSTSYDEQEPPGSPCADGALCHNDVAAGVSDLPLAGFPLAGPSFGILANGPVTHAADPNTSEGGNEPFLSPGPTTNLGQDISQFRMTVNMPSDQSCVRVDYAFFSEEFFEYINSTEFVDAFTLQVGPAQNVTIDAAGVIVAPANVALDSSGNPITTSTDFVVEANTGTTYDGRTELLTANVAATPGTDVTLTFTVLDGIYDSDFDSAVFLDNFRFGASCDSGSTPANPDPQRTFQVTLDDEPRLLAGLAAGGSGSTIVLQFRVTVLDFATGETRLVDLARQGASALWAGSVRLPAGHWRYDFGATLDDGSGMVPSAVARRGVHTGETDSPPVAVTALAARLLADTNSPAPAGLGVCGFTDLLGHFGRWESCEMRDRGIASGTTATTFEPARPITRGEMAIFLGRMAGLAPVSTPDAFPDDAGHFAEGWINAVAAAGFTAGCGGGLYCPDALVTRGEMAVFLVRVYESETGAPTLPDGGYAFTDIGGHFAEAQIRAIAGLGITAGTTATTYSPEAAVERGAMAIFVSRTLEHCESFGAAFT